MPAKIVPAKIDIASEYTTGGTSMQGGMLRRLKPTVFLTICSIFSLLLIVAALIVFTFLPIFTVTKDDQTKYQVRSDVLTLVYNLPDKASILSMNWTYEPNDFESDKLFILQNLLQDQLNRKKLTKKTSIAIMDAFITRQSSSSSTVLLDSSVTLDSNNNSVIIITQPDKNTTANSTTQLVVSLKLRYALDCAKKCQNNMRESIFEKTFHSLELPIDTFQTLFVDKSKPSTSQYPTSSPFPSTMSTTQNPCIMDTPASVLASSVLMAINYEAESLLNTFSSTTIKSCAVCSGEQKVTNIGFNNELIFQQIISKYGGSTIIVFYYTTDRIRSAEITVNNLFPSINVTFPSMSPDQNITSLPVTLNLCQGFNSLRIHNLNDYTPDFDRIIVY